jgi:acetyl coenzyme A synthetase (ADP forming)-like protein
MSGLDLTHGPNETVTVLDVILRDGRTLRLRPPVSADSAAVVDFFEALSKESIYRRFHGFPSVDERLAERLLDPDWDERGSLIAELDGRIVAHGEWMRLRDHEVAEVAFVVADELQGRGVGTRLLEQLAALAAPAGIRRFVAEVQSGNRPMLSMFSEAGFAVAREVSAGVVEVRLDLTPTVAYRERVDERDHLAVAASLEPFFRPRSLAVIGASARRGSIGGELFRNVLNGEFVGAAYPVNPRASSIAGVRAYPSVAEIPEKIDLALICLPGERVLEAAQEALEAGVRALVVISAGFAETGRDGEERQGRLLELVRRHGARLVGPNCLGIAVAESGLDATFAARPLPHGSIGFSSQSGALGLALLEAAAGRGLGLSSFVSIGNKADVSSNDLLEWWEEDERTKLVLLYLESFGNPRKFGRVARRVARRKPILAMKSGSTRSGQKAASSHTAALAGSEAAVDALFRQAGVLRASTLEELVDVSVLLSSQPIPAGRRVGVLTNAGGLGILCADACETAGLELPALSPDTELALARVLPSEASVANPVDMLGSATEQTYADALPPLLADPRLDAVIVLFVPPVTAGADDVAEAVRAAAEGSRKPVLAAILSSEGIPEALRESRVAAFTYPESAARALGRAAERGEWLRRPAGTIPELDVDRDEARRIVDRPDGWLGAGEARGLLQAYGIPVVPERLASDPDEAAAAARELGFPVVVKSAAAGAHKTESGGVALDLRDEAEVREATERIGATVIVQPLVRGGAELLAGVVQDPLFGPLVAFGPGGVQAELIGEAAFRIAPITDVDARELVRSGKAGKLVAGFRGAPAADEEALVDLVLRLARLADDLPEVAELDLNPVIAGTEGCVAVDARIRVQAPGAGPRLKTW